MSLPQHKLLILAFTLAVSLAATPTALAQSFNDQLLAKDVAKYEQHVFATTFEAQALSDRLSRLETVIFGAPQEGSNAVREQRLSQVLTSHIKAAQTATANDPNNPDYANNQQAQQDYEPDATSYPTVTALERKIVGRDFIHDEIGNRLTRLEQRVFRQSFPQTALIDRVDKLLARYPDVRENLNRPAEPDHAPSVLDSLPAHSSQFVGRQDTYTKLELLEQSLYGRDFSGQLITERLDRLEEKAYGYSYNGEAVDTRLSRLLRNHENAYTGTQSRPQYAPRQQYTHPNNQSAQFNTSRSSTYSNNGGQQIRGQQNIQIGAGIASNSQYSYSPELINMLPPDMRQQVYQQQQQTQQQQVYMGAPGTLTVEQEQLGPYGSRVTHTTQYTNPGNTGFNTYGGPPIQYRNYYSTPGLPQNNSQLGSPVYTGNPAVLSALNDLETKVYGAVNTIDTVPIRLGKMEAQLIGQVYEGYPDEERVNNLAKVYQYQSLGKVLGGGKAGNAIRGAGSVMLGIPLNQPSNTQPATETGTP